jgi:leucyl-tRNA synthetase
LDVDTNTSEEDITKLALDLDNVKKYIDNQPVKKIIYIQGKILNIVI